MKNLDQFKSESTDWTCLDDFTLTPKEWVDFEKGTKAIRVKTYNDSGNLVGREYVLSGLDNVDEVLKDMQAVACGYYTETVLVTKK